VIAVEVRTEEDIRALPPLLQEHVRQVVRAGGRVWFEDRASAPAATSRDFDSRAANEPSKPSNS
jgi:hypothetical protein